MVMQRSYRVPQSRFARFRQRVSTFVGNLIGIGMVITIILFIMLAVAGFAALPWILGALGIKWVFGL